jgi:hypothetical protein
MKIEVCWKIRWAQTLERYVKQNESTNFGPVVYDCRISGVVVNRMPHVRHEQVHVRGATFRCSGTTPAVQSDSDHDFYDPPRSPQFNTALDQ